MTLPSQLTLPQSLIQWRELMQVWVKKVVVTYRQGMGSFYAITDIEYPIQMNTFTDEKFDSIDIRFIRFIQDIKLPRL